MTRYYYSLGENAPPAHAAHGHGDELLDPYPNVAVDHSPPPRTPTAAQPAHATPSPPAPHPHRRTPRKVPRTTAPAHANVAATSVVQPSPTATRLSETKPWLVVGAMLLGVGGLVWILRDDRGSR